MTETWLVSVAIGPVQDFIKAARRTRDLWFGSYMLSEVSKAVAKALHEGGAELIFPATEKPEALKPDSELNVANRIVAQYEGDQRQVVKLIDEAKQAARDRLRSFIEDAKRRYDGKVKKAPLREEIWERQNHPEELLELYATWVKQRGDDYLDARQRLDRLTAARKNTRDFLQSALDPSGPGFSLPKSSLDGRRETVLPETLTDRQRRMLRLGTNEQLDLMGLVKRLAGEREERFTPTTRIALDGWIERVAATERGRESLKRIGEALEPLIEAQLVTRVKGNDRIYRNFPYDGALLYPERLEVALAQCRTGKLEAEWETHLKELRRMLQPLWKRYGQPLPYYVMLLADGDRMGELLDQAQEDEDHRAVSRRLAQFARSVPGIVRQYRGHCIYAGGDDVLALVPLEWALVLADALRQEFAETLKEEAERLKVQEQKSPTLSVGLAMAHMQTPMAAVRRLAERAEKLAKGDESDAPRNALGIVVAPRSGARIELRLRWNGAFELFQKLVKLYQEEKLPSRLAYELRFWAELFAREEMKGETELREAELRRILNRKRDEGHTPLSQETVDEVVRLARNLSPRAAFHHHLVARWLGAHHGVRLDDRDRERETA